MMKTRIIIILLLLGFFAVFQFYLGFSCRKNMYSKYKVVRIDNEFEVRSYSGLAGSENKLIAVLKFGGYASPRVVKFYSDKLKIILFQNAISQSGDFRCLQYDSQYQIVGRSNEILVGIEAAHKQKIGAVP